MIIRRYGNTTQRCNNTTACPAVLGLANGDFLVIGKVADAPNISAAELAEHGAGIGDGEQAVVVPADVIRAAAREIASEVS